MPDVIFSEPKPALQGRPRGGEILPALDVDARNVALETWRTFVSLLQFSKTGPSGQAAMVYRVPYTSIFIEQPDNVVTMPLPAISIVAGEGEHESYGLGAGQLLDETANKYGEGLVLYNIGDWVEELNVEVWASSIPERRSLVVGMTEAFTMIEESGTLRLKLPTYFDQVASFVLIGTRYIDDTDSARNRRRAMMRVQLTVPQVRLARFQRLVPMFEVEVEDAQLTGEAEAAAALANMREFTSEYSGEFP